MGRGKGKERPRSRTLSQGEDRTGRWCWSTPLMKVWIRITPQQVEGAGAPKHVKKQIHLTLPTSPAHVTTTESFYSFLYQPRSYASPAKKLLKKRGWSTDQMREFITNFQQKHGQQVPMPKIYGDEDSSDSEGLELADGTTVGKKTTGGAGGSGGGKPRKKPAASGGTGTGGSDSPSTSGGGGVGGDRGR